MINQHDAKALIAGFIFLLGWNCASARDWPQWRGPERNGVSQETGLLKEWPKEGPKLLWQIKEAGSGYSTPAVVGERLYLLGNEGLDNEFVQALGVQDGKKAWSTRLGKVGNPKQQPNFPAARSTPTVDGEFLYALSSDGDLACLEIATGKARWQKNVRTEFGGKPGTWAYAESPLIDGDVLVCTPGGSDATIVALNKMTGDLIWKSALPSGDEASYASAIIVDFDGIKQYVQILQKGLVGVAAKDGKVLWRYEKTAKGSPAVIPSPVADEGCVYSAGARVGGGLIQLKINDGAVDIASKYFSPKLPTDIGGTVKVGKYLYGTAGQALRCIEFTTGNIKWEERALAPASVCYADGCLYFHGENGDVALVEATSVGYHEKGHYTPADQPEHANEMEKSWAYPVVSNGRLYIRDKNMVWCYDVRSSASVQ